MILAFLVGILDKEHLVDKTKQGVAQLIVFLTLLFGCEVVGNLALSVKLGTELVASVTNINQEATLGLIGIFAEEVIEEVIHYERSRLQIDIEPEVVIVTQLIGCIGQCGIENSQQSVYGIHRYLPYSEETKHVVDAVGVEVLSHLAETCLPPGKTVLVHLLPVVGRESPVLSEHREIIGRSTGLAIHVEQTR